MVRDFTQRLAALPPEKRAVFEAQLTENEYRYNTFPLSYAQQRLWLLDQLQPGNTSYNIVTAFHLSGPLDVAALEQSFNTLLARHETLRTVFMDVRGQPLQVIMPPAPLPLPLIDLSHLDMAERELTARSLLDSEGQQVFVLDQGPLIRVTLLRQRATNHLLIVNMHHIISDGWSVALVTAELSALYQANSAGLPTTLPPLTIQYADYAVWQREQAQSLEQERQVAYWRDRLQTAPQFLELPGDFPRPPVQTYRGAIVQHQLPGAVVTRLQTLSRQEGVTLFMALLTAFQIVLYRQTGQDDLVVGMPIANRNLPEIESLIGFFVNTLALRLDVTGDPSYRVLLARTRAEALSAYAHQDVAFDQLLTVLNPARDLSYSPIFQVIFNMLNVPETATQWGDLAVATEVPLDVGAKVDLTLYLEETARGLKLDLVYNADLFAPPRMQAFMEQYVAVVQQVVAVPDIPVSRISLVTASAQAVLPDPVAPLSAHWEGAVHELFARHAAQTPTRIAVQDETDTWTYGEMEARGNQLAHFLHAHGIAEGSVVAIFAQRNAVLVWAILGILKAGAAYTILDPAYPAARLIDYLEQAQPQAMVIVADAGPLPDALADYVQSAIRCQITLPHADDARRQHILANYPTTQLDSAVGPNDIASITFTSGSTGRPKGILQRHGPLTHFLPWQQAEFDLNARDRFSLLSGLAHDPLQRDIFTPLCLGATICVPSLTDIGTPGGLARWLAHHAITVTNLTPAMLQLVTHPLADGTTPTLPHLRYAFTVGDALKRHDVARLWTIAPQVTCVNMYGSTETQRAVSFYRIPRDMPDDSQLPRKEVIPLGHGMRDVQLLVLTPLQHLTGIGELGEIYVRSPHLAKGYLNNAALTLERFITNSFTHNPADRLYRTGDLGRYLPDGAVEYVTRSDQQVKIRGFRIELGEIEAVLRTHPAVNEVAIIARDYTENDRRLVAYIVAVPALANDELVGSLRQLVQTHLPNYMLPAAFVLLDALPMTPNGKLDRQALPAPATPGVSSRSLTAPRTPIEVMLAQQWQAVLGIQQIDIDDNFFELGGHSLLATQLLARIIEATGINVTLRMLFEAPTIATFAVALTQHASEGDAPHRPALVPLVRQPRPSFATVAPADEPR